MFSKVSKSVKNILKVLLLSNINMSLIQKLNFSLIIVFIVFFLIIGHITTNLLQEQLENNIEETVKILVNEKGKNIDEYFSKLEKLGLQSANTIKKWLQSDERIDENKLAKILKYENGAYRTNLDGYSTDDVSGVFLSNNSELSDDVKKIILATEGKFDNYAKGVSTLGFNTYFITKHQLIRVYEKDWALKINADHDFKKLFLTLQPIPRIVQREKQNGHNHTMILF